MFVLPLATALALAVITFIEVLLVEFDRFGWSTFVLIMTGLLAYLAIPEVHAYWVATTWLTRIEHVAIYLGVGVVIAFLKWIQFNVKFANAVARVKAKFKAFNAERSDQLNTLLAMIRDAAVYDEPMINRAGTRRLLGYVGDVKTMEQLIDIVTPKAKENIDRITAWTFTWPFVIAHTVFADVFIKLGKHIATLFDNVFHKLTRSIVARGLK